MFRWKIIERNMQYFRGGYKIMGDYSYLVDLAISSFLFGAGFLAFMIGVGILLEILGVVVI